MTGLERCIYEIDLINSTLSRVNDEIRALLFDLRYKEHLCITCGKDIEQTGDEYCPECWDKRVGVKA